MANRKIRAGLPEGPPVPEGDGADKNPAGKQTPSGTGAGGPRSTHRLPPHRGAAACSSRPGYPVAPHGGG